MTNQTASLEIVTQPPGLPAPIYREPMKARQYSAKEFKVIALRECIPTGNVIDSPEQSALYWHANIPTNPMINLDCENLVILHVNTRHRVTGHNLASQGLIDVMLAHTREVFRAAIVSNASGIILMHNHPSGDPSPSEADIKVTRDFIRAGQRLKIHVLDHVIIGRANLDSNPKGYASLRELGYFHS